MLRTTNYTASGKPLGQSHHGQDTKRRRTDDVEDKEMLTSKPMRVSVVKQVHLSITPLTYRIPSIRNLLANPSVNQIPPNLKRASKSPRPINICIPPKVSWPPPKASNSPTTQLHLENPPNHKANDLAPHLRIPKKPPIPPASLSFSLRSIPSNPVKNGTNKDTPTLTTIHPRNRR